MTDSILDDIRKALQGEKKTEFLSQILKEKALYDALREAGLTVVAEDAQARAREQPYGVLSKVMKIDLVDLITEITTIKTLEVLAEITNIKNLESLDLIDRVALIDRITNVDTLANITNIANLESVDLIDTITNVGTLNMLNTIGQINKINPQGANNVVIDLLNTVNSIANILNVQDVKNLESVWKILQIDNISSVDLIDTITNVGTLNMLNTIGQINKINPQGSYNVVIDLLNRIAQVDTISTVNQIVNLGTLNKINEVTTLGTLNQLNTIGTINKINEIVKITSGSIVSEVISNSRFQTGDLTGWLIYSGSPSVDTNVLWHDLPSLKLPAFSTVWHYVNQGCYGYELCLFGAVRSDTANRYIMVYLIYTDLTTESFMWKATNANTWYDCYSMGTVNKPLLAIEIENPNSATITWLAGLTVLKVNQTIRQPTRTNLNVKPEREDTLIYSAEFSSSTAYRTVLDAVAGKRHKIYALGYDVDANGSYWFSAIVQGVGYFFGVRRTAGVYAQTFVHPIVCDENTTLKFMCNGGTAYVWVQYVTE